MSIALGLDPGASLVDRLRSAPKRLSNVGPVMEGLVTEAATEIERLRARLEHIAIVCGDNTGENCNHRMALHFVSQIANSDHEQSTRT